MQLKSRSIAKLLLLLILSSSLDGLKNPVHAQDLNLRKNRYPRILSVVEDSAGNFLLLNLQSDTLLAPPSIQYFAGQDGQTIMVADFPGLIWGRDSRIVKPAAREFESVRLGQFQDSPPIFRISITSSNPGSFKRIEFANQSNTLMIKYPEFPGYVAQANQVKETAAAVAHKAPATVALKASALSLKAPKAVARKTPAAVAHTAPSTVARKSPAPLARYKSGAPNTGTNISTEVGLASTGAGWSATGFSNASAGSRPANTGAGWSATGFVNESPGSGLASTGSGKASENCGLVSTGSGMNSSGSRMASLNSTQISSAGSSERLPFRKGGLYLNLGTNKSELTNLASSANKDSSSAKVGPSSAKVEPSSANLNPNVPQLRELSPELEAMVASSRNRKSTWPPVAPDWRKGSTKAPGPTTAPNLLEESDKDSIAVPRQELAREAYKHKDPAKDSNKYLNGDPNKDPIVVSRQELRWRSDLDQNAENQNSTKQERLSAAKHNRQSSTKQDLSSTKQDPSSTKQDLSSTKQDLNERKQDTDTAKQDALNAANPLVEYTGKDPLKVKLKFNSKISYKTFQLDDPPRFVIDLDGLDFRYTADQEPDTNPWLKSIRFGNPEENQARIVFDLHNDRVKVESQTDNGEQNLTISLSTQTGPARTHSAFDAIKLRRTIVLDAGHGGSDPGAQRGDIQEKAITLAITQKLKRYLEDHGMKIKMTRGDDSFVSLEDRVRICHDVAPDAFVSIHINSLETDRDIKGIETYYNTEKSRLLADKIHAKLVEELKVPDRSVRKARFYVVNHSEQPSVLAEVGFISNKDERDKLISSDYQDKIAESVGQGVILFLTNAVEPSTSTISNALHSERRTELKAERNERKNELAAEQKKEVTHEPAVDQKNDLQFTNRLVPVLAKQGLSAVKQESEANRSETENHSQTKKRLAQEKRNQN